MQSLEKLFDISGKTALVTGGASGIGAMITETLVDAGCTVYIASRKRHEVDRMAAEMNANSSSGKVVALTADLMTAQGTEGLAKQIAAATDKIDILVNNSGCTWGAPMEDFPREAWDKVLTLNVTAMSDLTRLLLPQLKAAGTADSPARIINIGSVMGTCFNGAISESDGAYSYAVSKAAVHHLTKILSNELAAHQITVNAIAPGPFPSRMMAFAIATEENLKAIEETIPMGRVGEPHDMACLIRWLCSTGGSFITGAVVPIDGGMAAKP